ncbi:RagB/SusD family nutrient uptake outer membrane protein [Polaribacter glomeratus]|nr:RagB/SusD family nutrient uptake outer membrane protein [Polaribacter glomeratus]
MKKSKYILSSLVAVFLLLASSCENVLDLEPISQIPDSKFWKTNADAELGVIAIYDAMQSTYRVKHFLWGDFRSDNYVSSTQPNADTESLILNQLDPEQSDYASWGDLYRMIFRANLAIAKIPEIPLYNKNLLGEAYALRAYAYFDAYRIWGGVPLFKDAALTFDESSFKARSTAKEVLDLALADLAEAEKLINSQSGPNATRFSVGAMLAFKAKVLMFLNKPAEANIVLQELIDTKLYSLTIDRTSWGDLFLNDIAFPDRGQKGTELIMSLRYEQAEDGNRASGVYQLHFPGVPGYWISPKVQQKWVQKFPTNELSWSEKYPGVPPPIKDVDPITGLPLIYGDYRYYETITQVGSVQDLRVSKYAKTNYSPRDDDTNIVLFRYADMLLLKAEAENQLDNPQGAVDLLDRVRVARGLPKVNSGTFPDIVNINDKAALENFILDERQLELFAEGTRWWDLVRTGKAVEVMGPINGQTEARITWPIYFIHLIDNPKLEQNEAYK